MICVEFDWKTDKYEYEYNKQIVKLNLYSPVF